MMRERQLGTVPGPPMAILFFAIAAGLIYTLIAGAAERPPIVTVALGLLALLDLLLLVGLFVVNPNEARVLQLFGAYAGTVKTPGLRWANPLYTKKRISLRVRNFESARLKVNDHEGNPIEIAAVVVWRVVDTAEAVFQVDDYQNFVKVQTESAVRNLATSYTYDTHDETQMSLGDDDDHPDHMSMPLPHASKCFQVVVADDHDHLVLRVVEPASVDDLTERFLFVSAR